MAKYTDDELLQLEFGKLRVIEIVRVKGKYTKALCECDCGNTKTFRLSAIVSGNTTSCNCKRSEANLSELPHSKRLMIIWDNIVGRCYRPRDDSYRWYGAVGITMCDEWRYGFRTFYYWAIENGYKEGLVIDKDELCEKLSISPKIYSPKTCKWTTREANLRREW